MTTVTAEQATLEQPERPSPADRRTGPGAFLAQIAQFTSLEQTRQMNDRVNTLLTIQSSTQAIGLIGRTAEVATATGSVVGKVTTLSFQSGTPFLTVQTSTGQFLTGIGLDQVSVIRL